MRVPQKLVDKLEKRYHVFVRGNAIILVSRKTGEKEYEIVRTSYGKFYIKGFLKGYHSPRGEKISKVTTLKECVKLVLGLA